MPTASMLEEKERRVSPAPTKGNKKVSDSPPISDEVPEKENLIPREVTLFGSKLEAATLYKTPYFLDTYQFPYNPDPLCRGNNYATYDEMQDDDQVKSALAIKRDMVVNTGWNIVCEDQIIKDYLTDMLKRTNMNNGTGAAGFDDSLRDILSAYAYGFSLSEPVHKLDPVNKWWMLAELRTRPPHSFRFEIDDKGNVIKVWQASAGKDLEFDPKLFIHHVYQIEFGNPYGRSDLRAAHASWVSKKFIMRFLNIYLERYASPTMVGKYKQTLTKADVSELLEILRNAQQGTAMVIPEDALIDFIQPGRDSSDSYGKALDKYDNKIARSILMPDLLGFSGGQTGGGSYSLGKQQFRAFIGIINKDRESLQNKITERILKPLVAVNWGEEAAKGVSFEFIPFSDDSIIEGAKVWSEAVRAVGWEPSDEEINHLRSITGFPEGLVERKQPLEIGPDGMLKRPNPIGKGMTGGKGEDKPPQNARKGPQDGQEGGSKPEDDEEGEDGKKTRRFRFMAGRKLTTYEKKVDFEGIVGVLNASEDRVTPALTRAAKEIYMDLIDQVRTKGILRNFKPEKINDIQPRFLKDMNMVFRNHFTDLFKAGMKEARAEIYKDVKGYAEKGDEDIMFPEDFLEILRAESFKIVGDYSMEVTKKAKSIIMQGMKDGVSEGAIVSLLREELGDVTDKWLRTVVRTKTTEIYNDSRKSYWDTDEIAAQVIVAYQFSAILDSRTSDVCRELDGKIYEKGAFLDHVTPPLHFNCRSLLVPITRFEPYKEDVNYVKPGKEPSLDSLREMGGGLIVGGK